MSHIEKHTTMVKQECHPVTPLEKSNGLCDIDGRLLTKIELNIYLTSLFLSFIKLIRFFHVCCGKMPRHSFLICLLVAALVALSAAQGVSRTGKKDGNAILKASKKLKAGNYVFKSAVGKDYLTFISSGNLVVPAASKHPRTWNVRNHDKTKYFSAHGKNKAGLEKCISTRWDVGNGKGGFPDAAVVRPCFWRWQ